MPSAHSRHRGPGVGGGAFLSLGAALLFGLNGSLLHVLHDTGLTPGQITMLRELGMSLLAGLVLLVTDRSAFRVTWRRLGAFALLGLIGLALVQAAYATALTILPVGVALLIEFTAVAIVPLWVVVVRRRPVGPGLWIAIGCVLAGMAVVGRVWHSTLDPVGFGYAVFAAFALAFYFLFGERVTQATSPLAVTFWAGLFGGLFWCAFSRWWTIPADFLVAPHSLTGALAGAALPGWALLAGLLVVGSFVPFLLSFAGMRALGPTVAGVMESSEVVFAFLFAWLWLGQTPDVFQLVGGAVVLTGLVIAQLARPGVSTKRNLPVEG